MAEGQDKDTDITPDEQNVADLASDEAAKVIPDKDKEPEAREIDTPTGRQSMTVDEAFKFAQSYRFQEPLMTQQAQELADLKREREASKSAPAETITDDAYGDPETAQLRRDVSAIQKGQAAFQQSQQEREMREWATQTMDAIDRDINSHRIDNEELDVVVKQTLRGAINEEFIRRRMQGEQHLTVKEVSSKHLDGLTKTLQSSFDRRVKKMSDKTKAAQVEGGGGGAALPEGKKAEDMSWKEITKLTRDRMKSSE